MEITEGALDGSGTSPDLSCNVLSFTSEPRRSWSRKHPHPVMDRTPELLLVESPLRAVSAEGIPFDHDHRFPYISPAHKGTHTMMLGRYFSKYNDYMPLNGYRDPRMKANTVRSLVFAALVIASLVLNVVFLVRHWLAWPSPLDDYQQLKQYPLINTSALTAAAPVSKWRVNENAVVTTLYTNEYAPAVAALGHSLRKVNTSARLIMLYIPSQISASALCLAASSGFVPHPVARISPPHNGSGVTRRFMDQFTKLSLWTLDALPNPVRALVYLDADVLALRNFDELFALPFPFAAVPDVFLGRRGYTVEFNAGVLFVRPDSALFRAMVARLPDARYPPALAEQAFLNQYFATDAIRLPYAYNGNLAIKSRSPQAWEGIKKEMRVLHYTLVKPFVSKDWKAVPLDKMDERVEEAANSKGGKFREEMHYWGKTWKETRTVYAQRMDECRRHYT